MDDRVWIGLEDATHLCVALLSKAGLSERNATVVAEHLVEASAMGVGSHGMARIGQYLDDLATGVVDADAEPSVTVDGQLIRIDGRRALGQVGGQAALEAILSTPDEQLLTMAFVRNTGHVGRLGAYTERLAHVGNVALAFASAPMDGHWVAPFGAAAGRMATNPISWAAPAAGGPIVADLATSTITEGQVRSLVRSGLSVPEDTLCDADGRPTTDGGVLYRQPRGFILPLGGILQGHRGSALGLLVEVMATALAGDVPTDASRIGNNLAILSVRADHAIAERVNELARYVRSAPPRDDMLVMMPGDREARARAAATHVELDSVAWSDIVGRAADVGVVAPSPARDAGGR